MSDSLHRQICPVPLTTSSIIQQRTHSLLLSLHHSQIDQTQPNHTMSSNIKSFRAKSYHIVLNQIEFTSSSSALFHSDSSYFDFSQVSSRSTHTSRFRFRLHIHLACTIVLERREHKSLTPFHFFSSAWRQTRHFQTSSFSVLFILCTTQSSCRWKEHGTAQHSGVDHRRTETSKQSMEETEITGSLDIFPRVTQRQQWRHVAMTKNSDQSSTR